MSIIELLTITAAILYRKESLESLDEAVSDAEYLYDASRAKARSRQSPDETLAGAILVHCPKLAPETALKFAAYMAGVAENMPNVHPSWTNPGCKHERLDEDGICRVCGSDRRGI